MVEDPKIFSGPRKSSTEHVQSLNLYLTRVGICQRIKLAYAKLIEGVVQYVTRPAHILLTSAGKDPWGRRIL